MKNKIYNIIASLASLVLGVILLVCVCLAWYVMNDYAKAEGVTGITSKGAFYDITLTRYVVATETKVEGQPTTYTMGSQLATEHKDTIRYDELSGYTKVIYKISFSTYLNGFSLSLKNTSSRTNSFVNENSQYYNYLSNVATFSKLKVNGSNSTIIIEDNNPIASDTTFIMDDSNITYSCKCNSLCNSLPDDKIHNNIINYVIDDKDVTSPQRITIFLLFDYSKDHINRLYSANLGINETIYFKDDLLFVLTD